MIKVINSYSIEQPDVLRVICEGTRDGVEVGAVRVEGFPAQQPAIKDFLPLFQHEYRGKNTKSRFSSSLVCDEDADWVGDLCMLADLF